MKKIPEGFEPCYTYDKTPTIANDYIKYKELDLSFHIDKKIPVLPFKASGEVWHIGWDIPTRWAVDSAGVGWKDGAHGGSLEPVSLELMKDLFMEEEKYWPNLVYLGLTPPKPAEFKVDRTIELLNAYQSQIPSEVFDSLIASLKND